MTFPRHVYKRGTGKATDDSGCFVAESALVKSEADLAKLEGEWRESPVDAAAPAEAAKPAKKVK